MKVSIGVDHKGFEKKEKVINYLAKKGIEVIDRGTDSNESCDYVDFANIVCDDIVNGEADFGILICGTGIGMSIVANKRKGIMCGKVDNYKEARLTKEHNHANVIAFSGSKSMLEIKDILDAYLKATPKEDEKYLRRIDKIKSIEGKRK